MAVFQKMIGMSKTLLGVKERPKIKHWPALFGSERPPVIALVGMARGGSHYVIDQFHKHPSFLGLSERVPPSSHIKRFFTDGDFSIRALEEGQLLPRKKTFDDVRYLITNKIDMEQTVYYKPVLGSRLIHMYCFRNPFSIYSSWVVGWKDFAERNCDSGIEQSWIDNWFRSSLISSLLQFALFCDEEEDLVVNLEVLASHGREALDPFLSRLGVPLSGEVTFQELSECPTCDGELSARTSGVKSVPNQEALFCRKCDEFILGPGGYNYIRKAAPADLRAWRSKPGVSSRVEEYAGFLGKEMVDYYLEEEYLRDPRGDIFKDRFKALMARMSYLIKNGRPLGGV